MSLGRSDSVSDCSNPGTARNSCYEAYIADKIQQANVVSEQGYVATWNQHRKRLGALLFRREFDCLLCVAVLGNILLLVIETDKTSLGEVVPDWVKYGNRILLVFYMIELVARLFVLRGLYFFVAQNWFDLLIVGVDVVIESMSLVLSDNEQLPSVVILRAFKLTRLTRSRRVLRLFPELYIMVTGLGGAMKAMLWGMILMMITLLLWSLLAVQLVHPLSKDVTERGGYAGCERCPRAFETVPAAFLTFMQHIIAGDSWGSVTIPIVEAYPITIIFFFAVICTVAFVVMNLILAIVVDGAASARIQTDHEYAKEKQKEFEEAAKHLEHVCKSLDTDKSGSLTIDEIQEGFQSNPRFQDAMEVLDLNEEDMDAVFAMMDRDKSGEVSYMEFVEQLYKIKKNNSHTMLVFIKYYVTDIRHQIGVELNKTKIMFNDLEKLFKGIGGMEARVDDLEKREGQASMLEIKPPEDAKHFVPRIDFSNDVQSNFDRLAETLQQVLSYVKKNDDLRTRLYASHESAFPSHTFPPQCRTPDAIRNPANDCVPNSVLHAVPSATLLKPSPQPPQTILGETPSAVAEVLCGGCTRVSRFNDLGSSDGLGQNLERLEIRNTAVAR